MSRARDVAERAGTSREVPARPSARPGFTLVESMAAIVVLAILGSLASSMILNATDDFGEAATLARVHTELSIGMDRIVRELRNVPLESGTAPDINTVTATSITWNDTDGDAYSVTLSGTDLQLAADGGAAATLLSDVSAFNVQAYDESDSALGASLSGASCDTIRRIEISITVTRSGVSETLDAKVFLRCTMSGASV